MVVSPGPCPESTSSAFPSTISSRDTTSCQKVHQCPPHHAVLSQEDRCQEGAATSAVIHQRPRIQGHASGRKEEARGRTATEGREKTAEGGEEEGKADTSWRKENATTREEEATGAGKDKEKMKKKKMEEKELKALLAASQKHNKEESESSDSGEEPVYDDDSDACEDITDNCHGCGLTTRQEVRIKCTLCDKWWHSDCVTQMDLKEKSQDDLDAMDLQFFCFCFFFCCTDQLCALWKLFLKLFLSLFVCIFFL